MAQRLGHVVPAQFLAQLAPGGRRIILARVEVTAAGGIPAAGKGILSQAPALEKNPAAGVVHDDMDGAMTQLSGVDFAAGRAADDEVVAIDHVEQLVRVRRTRGRLHHSVPALAGRAELDDFDGDRHHAVAFHLENVRRRGGDIDQPAAGPGAAVVDPHLHAPAVVLVGHPHDRAERHMAHRGGEVVLVEAFAAGSPVALGVTVPGSPAMLDFGVMVTLGTERSRGRRRGEKKGQRRQDENRTGNSEKEAGKRNHGLT